MKNAILTCLFLLLGASFVHAQIITTVAGGGLDTSAIHIGDGGPATAGVLYNPRAVAVDEVGNLYIADAFHYRVRKVNTDGIISTIAGTSYEGYNGDNIAATTARLMGPVGIAVDEKGNVYISDSHRIRKVDTAGIITTIAGTGTAWYSGDNGAATAAELYSTQGIAYDHGNIYVCDGARVRKIDSTGIITTIAGTGVDNYTGDGGSATATAIGTPVAVTIDTEGNLIIAIPSYNRVCKINTTGIISTVAGGNTTLGFSGDNGPATDADFHMPYGVAADHTGNIYISDSYNDRVRVVNAAGIITTYAGTGIAGHSGDNGPAIFADINGPIGLTINSSGNLFIAEYGDYFIRCVKNPLSANVINKNKMQMDVYPNFNQGTFTVNVSSTVQKQLNVVIANMAGEKIKEFLVTTNELQHIQLNLSSGIYFLYAADQYNVWTQKLVIIN